VPWRDRAANAFDAHPVGFVRFKSSRGVAQTDGLVQTLLTVFAALSALPIITFVCVPAWYPAFLTRHTADMFS